MATVTLPKEVLAGNALLIRFQVMDNTQTPAVLVDPTSGPLIWIKRSDGTMAESGDAAVRDGQGLYHYTYTTLSGDPVGLYKIWFTAIYSGEPSASIPKFAIKVVTP